MHFTLLVQRPALLEEAERDHPLAILIALGDAEHAPAIRGAWVLNAPTFEREPQASAYHVNADAGPLNSYATGLIIRRTIGTCGLKRLLEQVSSLGSIHICYTKNR